MCDTTYELKFDHVIQEKNSMWYKMSKWVNSSQYIIAGKLQMEFWQKINFNMGT